MANRPLTDERVQARRLYIEDGLTAFSDIELRVGVSRQTISRWAKEENWANQRTSTRTSAPDLAKRLIRVLEGLVNEVEQKQNDGEPISPDTVKRMVSYSKTIRSLETEYDERGVLLSFSTKLINYIATLPGEKELLKGLRRVIPGFFNHING